MGIFPSELAYKLYSDNVNFITKEQLPQPLHQILHPQMRIAHQYLGDSHAFSWGCL